VGGENNSTRNKTLKLAGRHTINFPKRERFNEDSQEVIKEMRDTASQRGATLDNLNAFQN